MSNILANDMKRFIGRHLNSLNLMDYEIGTYSNGKVMTDQSKEIPASVLVIPEYLTDWEVGIEVAGLKPEFSLEGNYHLPGGLEMSKQKCIIKNHLKDGDRVILLQKPGGQQYLILARVGS